MNAPSKDANSSEQKLRPTLIDKIFGKIGQNFESRGLISD